MRSTVRFFELTTALPRSFFVLVVVLAASATTAEGLDYYVRPDGGSATECTGLANAPYPGNGSGVACAWDHPFRALPPDGEPRISGGDALHIASGSYMMGIGAPETSSCESEGAWECVMPAIPSGPSPGSPTRIMGDCTVPPELWGTERAEQVIDLTGSSNVEIACLEITDHSGCVEWHSGDIGCTRDAPPFGDWAARGIYAVDATNVTLSKLDIHGLAAAGVHAGRLSDWTVTDVRIAANGWVGWDGDVDEDSSNDGQMRFLRWLVEWNGCGESWPGKEPGDCWGQSAGGYGDGVGTGATRGHWTIDQSTFRYNTSDGLDLLYLRPGSSVEIRRTLAVGNAGNQIKTSGPAVIENSIIVGNCGWFGQNPVTFDVDNCRAAGNALSLSLFSGDSVSLINSTLASEGDCVILAECAEASCTGDELLRMRNNVIVGDADFDDPADRSCLMYLENLSDSIVDADYTIAFGTKGECPGVHDYCGVDPLVGNRNVDHFDATLREGSPAIGSAESASAPAVDYDGTLRDTEPDRGALEYGDGAQPPPPHRRRAVRRH